MRFRDPELRFTLVAALVLVVLAVLPELAGLVVHLPRGVLPFQASDTGVYFSYIEQIRQGAWPLRDLMTSEPQPVGFVNGFWMLVGLLARLFDLAPHGLFVALRLLFVPVAALAALYAARTFLEKREERRLALLLILFASGWGAWTVVVTSLAGMPPAGGRMPIDLWVPETSLLGMVMHSAHFLASFAALVTAVAAAFRYARDGRPRQLLLAAVLLLALGLFHPYYVPLVLLIVLAGWLALLPTGARFWRLLGAGLALAACGIVGVLPHALPAVGDLTTILRNAGNATPMPGLAMALLAAGAFLPLALVALWRGRDARTPAWRFLVAWLLVHAAAVYAPIPWQRKMTEGLIVPFALLSAPLLVIAAARLFPSAQPAVRRTAGAAALFFLFGATTVMIWMGMIGFWTGNYAIWLTRDDRAAFTWMRESLPEDTLVVATAERGNAIAAFAGRTSYAGHWSETIGLEAKLTALDWLGSGARDDAARLRFLKRAGISHVFVGPLERSRWNWDPERTAGLREEFRSGEAAVYALEDPGVTLPGN